MEPQRLQLLPNEDEKRWVAEITGEDKVFRLKRDFQPEEGDGIWEIYDGWYQIHGQAPGVTPFQKEYVHVKNGRMLRHLSFGYMVQQLEEIKAAEPARMERLKRQIFRVLDDIKVAAPYEPVEEAIERQKEDCEMIEESGPLLAALTTLKKQKDTMIKEYQKTFANWNEW